MRFRQTDDLSVDRARLARGRRGRLSVGEKETLLLLFACGEPVRIIADRFDVEETYVRKLACRYRVATRRPANSRRAAGRAGATEREAAGPMRGAHLFAYRRARRGFHVPSALESDYVRLLVEGLTKREAARRLGLARNLFRDVHDRA